jgi:anhydro-N-acetylmuramic acid kinase
MPAAALSCRSGPVDQLIATGGGTHNPALMKMIAAELPDVEVVTAEHVGVDGGALEAVAFAILGARTPAILGKMTLPP